MIQPVKPLFPFLAKQADVNELIAPPYDIVNHQQVQAYLSSHPQSIISVTRPDGLFAKSGEMDIIKQSYQAALEQLNEKKSYLYQKYKSECFLIYQILGAGVLQTGLLCLANSQQLKKHELTRKAKVEDRMALSYTLKCQISPVMLCTKAEVRLGDQLNRFITEKSPYYEVSYQNYQHRLFLLNDSEEVAQIQKTFSDDISIYITDGHHRSQTQLSLHEQNPDSIMPHVLSVIFPSETLQILGYHRVVKMPDNTNDNQFWQAIESYFEVQEQSKGILPDIDHIFGCYIQGKWYQLNFKDESSPHLAIDILHKNVIEPFFEVTNPKEDPNIDFIGGLNALTDIEHFCQTNPNWVGFTIAPTTVEEIIKTADANGIMPPKSTYFEPKLLDGFLLQDE